ncbi:MAG: hypothetical protein BA863_17875 [Desulfovibrio sp. S3730MH75]|nr:MAG: hypothetical protein BA863_17875 [Desulfovibrio sp. S3730MH75]
MPDKYGRFNMKDGMTFANQGMGLMNQFKRNEIYDAELGEIERVKEDRNQVGLGLAALRGDKGRPEKISEQNWTKAQRGYAEGVSYKDQTDRIKREEEQRLAKEGGFNNAWETIQTGGVESVQYTPGMNLSQIQGTGDAIRKFGETKDGAVKASVSNNQFVAQNAAEFMPRAQNAVDAYKSGNSEAGRTWLRDASKKLGTPWSLGEYEEGKGFKKLFRSDKTGKADTSTGQYVSEDEALSLVQKTMSGELVHLDVGGKTVAVNKFLAGSLISSAKATGQTNHKNLSDESTHKYYKDGTDSIALVPQSSLKNHTANPSYLVLRNGQLQEGMVTDLESTLKSTGWTKEDLAREGKRTAIDHTKQTTDTSMQSMIASRATQVRADNTQSRANNTQNRENAKAQHKKLTDQYTNSLKILKEVGGIGGDVNTFDPKDPASFFKANNADKAPFIEKIVKMANDMNLSEETRSAAQTFIKVSQQLGYIQKASVDPNVRSDSDNSSTPSWKDF